MKTGSGSGSVAAVLERSPGAVRALASVAGLEGEGREELTEEALAILEEIARAEDERVVPLLIEVAPSAGRRTKRRVVLALGRSKGLAAAPFLLKGLTESSFWEAEAHFKALVTLAERREKGLLFGVDPEEMRVTI